MGTRLFVDGFPSSFTDQELRELFILHGTVLSAEIVRDSRDQSLRFGHVEMASSQEANTAIQRVHRSRVQGEFLLVQLSKQNANGPNSPSTEKVNGV